VLGLLFPDSGGLFLLKFVYLLRLVRLLPEFTKLCLQDFLLVLLLSLEVVVPVRCTFLDLVEHLLSNLFALEVLQLGFVSMEVRCILRAECCGSRLFRLNEVELFARTICHSLGSDIMKMPHLLLEFAFVFKLSKL